MATGHLNHSGKQDDGLCSYQARESTVKKAGLNLAIPTGPHFPGPLSDLQDQGQGQLGMGILRHTPSPGLSHSVALQTCPSSGAYHHPSLQWYRVWRRPQEPRWEGKTMSWENRTLRERGAEVLGRGVVSDARGKVAWCQFEKLGLFLMGGRELLKVVNRTDRNCLQEEWHGSWAWIQLSAGFLQRSPHWSSWVYPWPVRLFSILQMEQGI